MRRVHLIGIGGSGLSAIATVLVEKGFSVTGSDRQMSPVLETLRQKGVSAEVGHRAENVHGADVVLRSSAVPDDNVEVREARRLGIPVVKRTEFFEQLTAGSKEIAIAGSHGKTTTTAMIAWMLKTAGLDASYIIGGESINLNGNAHAGQGEWFVIEADEYDGMFLGLHPTIEVITNIEHDHPDCYPTFEEFFDAFYKFVHKLKPEGSLFVNAQNAGAARLGELAKKLGCDVLTFGFDDSNLDYWAKSLGSNDSGGYDFEFHTKGDANSYRLGLKIPGLHNGLNALAAFGVADKLSLDLTLALQSLESFTGTSRRFEVRTIVRGVTIIDDYAHHPTEIRATLEAARSRYPTQRIWAVWQPHTFSRTRAFLADYLQAFDAADVVVLLDIYAAREQPPVDGFSSKDVTLALQQANPEKQWIIYKPSFSNARDYLLEGLGFGDVVIVLSAGDAIELSADLHTSLKSIESDSGVIQNGDVDS